MNGNLVKVSQSVRLESSRPYHRTHAPAHRAASLHCFIGRSCCSYFVTRRREPAWEKKINQAKANKQEREIKS